MSAQWLIVMMNVYDLFTCIVFTHSVNISLMLKESGSRVWVAICYDMCKQLLSAQVPSCTLGVGCCLCFVNKDPEMPRTFALFFFHNSITSSFLCFIFSITVAFTYMHSSTTGNSQCISILQVEDGLGNPRHGFIYGVSF